MHAFAKMPLNMRKFGSANNLSGNNGECAVKGIVKDHPEKIHRQLDEFSEQCTVCKYESIVINYGMTDISSKIGVSRHCSKKSNKMLESRGRFTANFG
jgi:hypothetical protein